MMLRLLTAVVLIPVVVVVVLWTPSAVIAALAALVLLLALDEFFRLAERMAMRGYRFWTMLCALALIYAQWAENSVQTRHLGGNVELVRNLAGVTISVEAVLMVFLLGATLIGIFGRQAIAELLPAISSSSAALLFVALPFSYIIRFPGIDGYGRQLALFTLCLVWAGDMLAYVVGKFAGRIPLAPALSPKKTWEGAAANLAASLIVAACFARWMRVETTQLLVIATCGNIAGQLGDLIESAYKRGAGTKDSGTILPGHGGMLDRIDSLILAAPAVWWISDLLLRR